MIEGFETDTAGLGLRRYVDVVRRRKLIVFLVLLVTVLAAVAEVAYTKPTYRATTKIVIGQGSGLFSPNLSTAIQPFSATMSDLAKSNIVARTVKNDLGLAESEEQLLHKVSISIKPESSVLTVSVDDHSRALARAIAQDIGVVFSDLVKKRFGKATPVGPGQAPLPPLTATVWDPAHISPGRVSPRPKRDLALAAALGLILGLLAAFLRDHFDRRLRSREQIEEAFGAPVIGQIPLERRRTRRRPVVTNLFGESSEAYRAVRTNLQYLGIQRPLRAILVTSSSPQQGKTTVTANLAVALARSGASTIAVEADLRRPRLAEILGIQVTTDGLTNVLVGNARVSEAVGRIPLGAEDDGAGRLAFLPSGPLPPNPSELLSSEQMRDLLAELTGEFDYVLIDSPPLLAVADALELARLADGVLLVVRRSEATTDEAREVHALVERLGLHLLGTVVTGSDAVSTYYGDYGAAPETSRRVERRRAKIASKQG
jgi:receptor protein-tyrosine kinase